MPFASRSRFDPLRLRQPFVRKARQTIPCYVSRVTVTMHSRISTDLAACATARDNVGASVSPEIRTRCRQFPAARDTVCVPSEFQSAPPWATRPFGGSDRKPHVL